MKFKYVLKGRTISYISDTQNNNLQLSKKEWESIISLTILDMNEEEHLELPKSLEYLRLENIKIRELPLLPTTLITLICNNTNIKKVPKLPLKIGLLNLSYNQIEYFEDQEFPSSLVFLKVNNNKLKYLPRLQHTNIVTFNVSNNQLRYIDINCLSTNKLNFLKNNIKEEYYSNNKWINIINSESYSYSTKNILYMFRDIYKFIGFTQFFDELLQYIIEIYCSECLICQKKKLIGYDIKKIQYLVIRFRSICQDCKFKERSIKFV